MIGGWGNRSGGAGFSGATEGEGIHRQAIAYTHSRIFAASWYADYQRLYLVRLVRCGSGSPAAHSALLLRRQQPWLLPFHHPTAVAACALRVFTCMTRPHDCPLSPVSPLPPAVCSWINVRMRARRMPLPRLHSHSNHNTTATPEPVPVCFVAVPCFPAAGSRSACGPGACC